MYGLIDLAYESPSALGLVDGDVVFFATPHGVAMGQAEELISNGVRVIDLAADFRMKNLNE